MEGRGIGGEGREDWEEEIEEEEERDKEGGR